MRVRSARMAVLLLVVSGCEHSSLPPDPLDGGAVGCLLAPHAVASVPVPDTGRIVPLPPGATKSVLYGQSDFVGTAWDDLWMSDFGGALRHFDGKAWSDVPLAQGGYATVIAAAARGVALVGESSHTSPGWSHRWLVDAAGHHTAMEPSGAPELLASAAQLGGRRVTLPDGDPGIHLLRLDATGLHETAVIPSPPDKGVPFASRTGEVWAVATKDGSRHPPVNGTEHLFHLECDGSWAPVENPVPGQSGYSFVDGFEPGELWVSNFGVYRLSGGTWTQWPSPPDPVYPAYPVAPGRLAHTWAEIADPGFDGGAQEAAIRTAEYAREGPGPPRTIVRLPIACTGDRCDGDCRLRTRFASGAPLFACSWRRVIGGVGSVYDAWLVADE